MWTYVSELLAGTADPFWPHFALISGSVLAGIAVGAGIIFESNEYSVSVHRVAKWLVIGGVAVESLCTVCLFVFDERISDAQQAKIIALETRLAARQLSDRQIDEMKRELREYHGQVFLFDAYAVKEITDIGGQIANTLTDAGWERRSQPPNSFLKSVVGGIAIFVDEEAPVSTKEAARRLAELLNHDGVAATPIPRNLPTDKAVIGIQAGIKP